MTQNNANAFSKLMFFYSPDGSVITRRVDGETEAGLAANITAVRSALLAGSTA